MAGTSVIPPCYFEVCMIKRIVFLVVAFSVLLGCVFYLHPPRTAHKELPEGVAELREDIKYIIHAAGRLEGVDLYGEARTYDGSNSPEGLMQCSAAGARFVELDFNFTSDGELVCLHDWYRQYAPEITDYEALTLEEFLGARIYRNYTPICLDDVAEWLINNPDSYIVTDIKDDNPRGLSKIAEDYPDLRNRFIVQIYAEEEYDVARSLGFDYIIYTLYRLDWAGKTDWRHLGEFEAEHPLVGFTFDYTLIGSAQGYLSGMLSLDVPLFIHTVNEQGEQEKYFAMGIDGIYTDIVK